jgi:virginiamycin B lyase
MSCPSRLRTVTRLLRHRLVPAVLLVAALVPASATAAEAPAPAPEITGLKEWGLGERTVGNSVAVGADGTAWFGTYEFFALPRVRAGKVEVLSLAPSGDLEDSRRMGSTESVQVAADGDLWFLHANAGKQALLRRTPAGKLRGYKLPGHLWIRAFATGPEGNVWFTRGRTKATRIGVMTPAGKVTEQPLAAGSSPASIAAGPDGDYWFTEELAGKVGRISASGGVQLFDLAPGTRPGKIVAGPDGALWFSAHGPKGSGWTIGRITTEGAVIEFHVPFGGGVDDLAPDPRGAIWFTTRDGELSSISTNGEFGPRGCLGDCSTPIQKIAVGPEGAVWFAAGKGPWNCSGCGGEASLMAENAGASVGKIPLGALEPAGAEAQ